MSKREELEKKREEILAARAKEEEAQYEKDLEARFALEVEHGPCAEIKMRVFKSGQPTRAYVRVPTDPEYRRLKDLLNRYEKQPKKGQEAVDQIAMCAWVYPADEDAQKAMLQEFPGLLSTVAAVAVKLAQGSEVDAGKD